MTTPTPEDLIEQAFRLATSTERGQPKQVDLRRAVSAAYYAVFHAALTATADEFVGRTKRMNPAYGLIYRSVDHRQFRELCEEAGKRNPSARLAAYWPVGGFSADVKLFASLAIELQDARNNADYNPMLNYTAADVVLTIEGGRRAVGLLAKLANAERRLFVTLLAFRARAS